MEREDGIFYLVAYTSYFLQSTWLLLSKFERWWSLVVIAMAMKKVVVKVSQSALLFQTCCTLFGDLEMPAHSRIFFQSCSSWGIADDKDFLWKSALEYGGDPNKSRPQLRGLHLQHPSSRPQFSPKGLSVTQKVFFVVLKHLLKHSVRWRTFGTRKNTMMIGSSLERFHQDFARRKLFFSDKCFRQRERIGKENVHCL